MCHCDIGMCTHRSDCRNGKPRMKTVDLTQDAPKTHQDRDIKDRVRRLQERMRGGEKLENVVKGILDLLADEL
jgi:hypothetical protein